MKKILSVGVFLIASFCLSGCDKPQKNLEKNAQLPKSELDSVKLSLNSSIERYTDESPISAKLKTRFGELSVQKTDNGKALYLEKKKIYPIATDQNNDVVDYCSYYLEDLYQTNDKDIVIISEHCGGASDGGWYFMMTISSSQPVVSDSFAVYERNRVKVDGQKILIPQFGNSPYKDDKGRMVKDIEAIYDGGSVKIIREVVSEKELYSIKQSSCSQAYEIYKEFVFGSCNSERACNVTGMSTERACYSFDLGDDLDNKMTSAGKMACQDKNATLNYEAFSSQICGL